MSNISSLDSIYNNLFRKDENLTHKQVEQLRRYEAAFTIWIDKPWMPDKEIRNYLMTAHGVSQSQAYIDIKNLQLLLGKVKNSSKEWFRHMANEMIKDAVKDLDDAKDKVSVARAIGKISAANTLVGVNRLNKLDADPYDWSQIQPQSFEPTNDPAEAGLVGVTREELRKRIDKLTEKYSDEIEIQDITYEEFPDSVD